MSTSIMKASSQSGAAVQESDESSPAYVNANRKLTYIPLVFIVGRMFGTLRFLLLMSSSQHIMDIGSYIAPLQVGGVRTGM